MRRRASAYVSPLSYDDDAIYLRLPVILQGRSRPVPSVAGAVRCRLGSQCSNGQLQTIDFRPVVLAPAPTELIDEITRSRFIG